MRDREKDKEREMQGREEGEEDKGKMVGKRAGRGFRYPLHFNLKVHGGQVAGAQHR